jgi:hypothetical protein
LAYLPPSKSANVGQVTVVGRMENTFGRITNLILGGTVDLKSQNDLEANQLIQQTSNVAKHVGPRWQRPLAFVGIGFGPAPATKSDGYLWKGGEFDETKHPRVPEGSPEGGEFCSVDGASNAEAANDTADGLINQNIILKDLSGKLTKTIARKTLKNRLIAGLRAVAGIVADAVPYVGEIFDAYEITQALKDFAALKIEVTAAEAYVEDGPHALEALQVDGPGRSFSSAEAFKKDELGKVYGSAGDGWDYHHIVWQGGESGKNIPAELLHSTENMVRVPRLLHEVITSEYGKPSEVAGKTIREWLGTQPYEAQRAYGLKVMRDLGIIK